MTIPSERAGACPACGGCGLSDDWRNAVLDENEQRVRGDCKRCGGTGVAETTHPGDGRAGFGEASRPAIEL